MSPQVFQAIWSHAHHPFDLTFFAAGAHIEHSKLPLLVDLEEVAFQPREFGLEPSHSIIVNDQRTRCLSIPNPHADLLRTAAARGLCVGCIDIETRPALPILRQ